MKEISQKIKRRILLIDDDPLVLKTFTRLLESQSYEVIAAASYDEALEAIQQKDFDLVLSDIRMPGKNGVETVTDIQSNLTASGKKDLPIIFITGYAEFDAKLKVDFLGEVLSKPVDNEKLLFTIRDYL